MQLHGHLSDNFEKLYNNDASKQRFDFSGCVFDVVSNSQFNLMQDMSETAKQEEQCHAMVHILQ